MVAVYPLDKWPQSPRVKTMKTTTTQPPANHRGAAVAPPGQEERSEMAKVLDGPFITVMSKSNPETKYRIWKLGQPEQWCECPGYKYQGGPVSERSCKHTRALLAVGVVAAS